jgi:hypothetical protein
MGSDPTVFRYRCRLVDAVDDILPETIQVRGAGKDAVHPDDGDKGVSIHIRKGYYLCIDAEVGCKNNDIDAIIFSRLLKHGYIPASCT